MKEEQKLEARLMALGAVLAVVVVAAALAGASAVVVTAALKLLAQ